MKKEKKLLTVAGEIGKSGVGDISLFPDSRIAKLVAIVIQTSPGKFEIKEGKILTREMFARVTLSEEPDGYIVRTLKDEKWTDGSPDPCSIIELWLVVKKIIFEVRRALIDPKSGNVLLMPVFDIDLVQAEIKNERAYIKSVGIYYKLPGIIWGEKTSSETLDKVLTPEVLIDQSVDSESLRELGIDVSTPIDFMFYLIVNHYPDKITERWIIVIPTPPGCWSYPTKKKLEVKYLGPNELLAFWSTSLIDEKTFELSLVALSLASPSEEIKNTAIQLLKERKPSYEDNIYTKGEESITELRKKILFQQE